MEYLFIPLLIAIFICIFIIIKNMKTIKEYKETDLTTFEMYDEMYKMQIQKLRGQVAEAEREKELVNERLADVIQKEKEIVLANVENTRETAMRKLEDDLKLQHEQILSKMLNEQTELDKLIAPLREELKDYRAKRAAVNESILREQSLEMQKDFHRIVLPDISKEDISYLLSVEEKIHNKEILRKLIYETYVRPAIVQMQKRVLENKDFSGIYKITDSTGRIYIGQSTSIKSRWQSHCKEALGIGGISHQLIHNAIKQRGWDDFTWEVIEKCEKTKLNEREKYYVSLYESNIYGYNMKAGG